MKINLIEKSTRFICKAHLGLTLGLTCLSLPLSASTFYIIDTTLPLMCTLSFKHHNRIMIDKGRISKIISPDERIAIRMEEESGQAFIYALTYIPESTTVSVVTNTGLIQDIEIQFADRCSEVVILTDPSSIEEIKEPCDSNPKKLSLDEVVSTILRGKIPAGYKEFLLEDEAIWEVKKGINVKPVKQIQNCEEIIFIYEVENTTRYFRKLCEKEFERDNSRWVLLETNKLKPNETILVIVSVGIK